jgi:hypothetical protein
MTNPEALKDLPFDLMDLDPKEITFTIGNRELTLCKWSLRVRAWAIKRFTSEGIDKMFRTHDLQNIAELAYFMLKDEHKKEFPTLDSFLDIVSSVRDQLNLIKALVATLGIGEGELKKIDESMGSKEKSEPQNPNG